MALKGRPPAGFEEWMEIVAEFMQYEQMNFSLSARAVGKSFKNSEEERQVEHSEAFMSVLKAVRKERHARLLEELSKEAMEAELWDVVKELRKERQSDKVFGPASLLIKMRGWAIEEPEDRPVFANLTQAKVDEVRARLKEQVAKEQDSESVKVVVVNGEPN